MRRFRWPSLILLAMGFCAATGDAHAATVQVKFASGTAEISPLNDGVPFYINHKGHATNIPTEMDGLSYTRRRNGIACDATLAADGDTTVYVIVESEDSKHHPNAILQTLANAGWTRVDAPDSFGVANGRHLAAFKRSISAQQLITLDQPGPSGFFVAAKDLAIDGASDGGGVINKNPDRDSGAGVTVKFPDGDTELDTVKSGVKFMLGQNWPLKTFPDELKGLTFTRRAQFASKTVDIDVPAGAVLYTMFVSGQPGASGRQAVQDEGFTQVGPAVVGSGMGLLVYKKSFSEQTHLTVKAGGVFGVVVAANKIELAGSTPGGSSSAVSDSRLRPDTSDSFKAIAGPTTRVAQMQTAINGLVVYRLSSGLMLGRTLHTVLTILRGDSPAEVNFRFISNVGPEMRSARDEAVRYVHVRYPNWTASGAELTFAERDEHYEGGSIGAALSTLLLSSIQGFTIDRNVAVTGDVSADGTVLKIGGVYAKVHGAEAANCTLVVIPTDNFGELLNTESFIGKGEVPLVQVIGADTVDDVIAAVRTDRDAKLSEAVEEYDQVQQNISHSKGYLHSPECAEKLTQILTLCPRHFSAKLLLMEATGKRPKTLSAGASRYYISVAVDQMMPVLAERAKEGSTKPPSSVVHQGLDDLEKLRAICDPNLLPLIEAWERFIRTLSSVESGLASPQNLEAQRQAVIDAAAKVDMNADLMQKMLKEGI